MVYVVISGPQSAVVAEKMAHVFKQLVQEIVAEGKKPFVYVDATHVKLTDVTTAARVAIKESFAQPFVALAAVGNTRLIELVMYLAQAGNAARRMRYFTSEIQAKYWLAQQQQATPVQPQPHSIILGAFGIATISIAGLVGWLIGNPYLTSIIPQLRPINPVGAAGLLVLSVALVAAWRGADRTRVACTALLFGLGLLALSPFNAGMDFWLFGDQVRLAGAHTQLADSGAIGFIITGIMLALYTRSAKETHLAYAALAYALAGLGLFNSLGLLYARDFMYNISQSFVMALPLSLAFLAAGATLAFARANQRTADERLSRTSWLIVVALVVVQVVTYGAWQLNTDRNLAAAQESLGTSAKSVENTLALRLRAYTDALRGFSGLFQSSDYVDQGEFETYYRTIRLAENYPGVRAVSFISQVETRDIPAFLAQHRLDASLVPGGNKALAIQHQSASNTHYIVTYIAGSPTNSSLETDLTDSPGRKNAFEQAAKAQDIVSSGTVTLANPAQDGFFLTIPVKTKTGAIGYVNVVLDYDELFTSMFSGSPATESLNMHISDSTDPQPIYLADNAQSSTTLSATTSVRVADRAWNIGLRAPQNFGIASNQQDLAPRIAGLGQILSILLVAMFVAQNSARKRALELADTITADLLYERNQAVALRQKDETILSGMAEGLIIFDKQGKVERINAAAERILGYANAEIANVPIEKALPAYNEKGEHIPPSLRPAIRAIQKNTVITERLRYQRKNGTFFDAQVTTAPLVLGGDTMGVVEVFRDITKELEFERAKGDFVSLASHQLRTPLSAINWYTEMLLDGDMGKLKPDQKAQIQQIYDGNQRMIELVDALLNVSRLSVGKLRNEPEDLSFTQAADSVIQELTVSIRTKHLSLTKTIPSSLPTIFIDPKLLRIVIQNLLSNAVKYTPVGGSITITATVAPAKIIHHARLPRSVSYILLTVADTGYGIPKAQQMHIFEKLYRAENVQRLDVEGTGLGLYIVREVAEMLGGRIWFESMESVGTTFSVLLPVKTKPSK